MITSTEQFGALVDFTEKTMHFSIAIYKSDVWEQRMRATLAITKT